MKNIMKHFITIPQRIIIERNFAIDVVDAMVMEALIFIGTSPRAKRKEVDGEVYFWASYKAIEGLLPLIGKMNRKAWRSRFLRLERAGLIKVNSDANSRCAMTFVAFGPRYDDYVASDGWRKEDDVVGDEEATCYPKVTPLLPKGNTPCYPKVTPLLPKGNTKDSIEGKLNEGKLIKEESTAPSEALPPDPASDARSGSGSANGDCLETLVASLACGNSQTTPSHYDFSLYDAARAREKKRRAAWSLDDVRSVLSIKEDGEALLACFDATEDAWASWLDYKRAEKKGNYKRADTFALQVERIARECNYDPDLVRESIEQSRANGWQGLYPSKKRAAAPYSYEATPSGAPLVENLRAELREFYARHPEALKEITGWLDDAGYMYDKQAMAALTLEFCAFRVAGMHFGDTFAQHHAALFKRVQHVASIGTFKRKPFTQSEPHELNPVKF